MSNIKPLIIFLLLFLLQNVFSQTNKYSFSKENTNKNKENYRINEQSKLEKDTFVDNRDGHVYKIEEIGSQVWMVENLAYKAESGCWAYNNNINNVGKYGYLYDFQTAKNVCPDDWHLPAKAEFETLLDNYGGGDNYNNKNYKALISGGTSKFYALLGGWRYGYGGDYSSVNEVGYFWSASALDTDYAWLLFVTSNSRKAGTTIIFKGWGFSVRCVQDD